MAEGWPTLAPGNDIRGHWYFVQASPGTSAALRRLADTVIATLYGSLDTDCNARPGGPSETPHPHSQIIGSGA